MNTRNRAIAGYRGMKNQILSRPRCSRDVPWVPVILALGANLPTAITGTPSVALAKEGASPTSLQIKPATHVTRQ